MDARRPSLFCDIALAERIEGEEAELVGWASAAAHKRVSNLNVAARSGFVLPIAGGVACFAEPGSPYNKVAGLGFHGVPTAEDLAWVERAFAEVESPVQVELASLADPAIGSLLSDRGYRLEAFEDVLGRRLTDVTPSALPEGVEVRTSGVAEFDLWLAAVLEAVEQPDTEGVPWNEEFPREVIENAERDFSDAPGAKRYVALIDGAVVGGASIRITNGIAQMAGAATVPAYRRRGVQTALLATRLAEAAAAGCDIAVITTQPGSRSHQNAQRSGFDLLYTRAILVKP
jgi:GNAT superfamily N-acetyltransferase